MCGDIEIGYKNRISETSGDHVVMVALVQFSGRWFVGHEPEPISALFTSSVAIT
jgi:hypothetical protein